MRCQYNSYCCDLVVIALTYNPLGAKHDYNRFQYILQADQKSLLLGIKLVFKHRNLKMFVIKLNKYE